MKKMAIMAITMLMMVAVLPSVVNADSVASVSTDKTDYMRGENVLITITNNCRGPLALCTYTIENEKGEPIYAPKMVAFTTILEPGELYTYTWMQNDDCGNTVTPGTYIVNIQYDSVKITILKTEEPSTNLVTDQTNYEVGENIIMTFTNIGNIDAIVNGYWIEDSNGTTVFAPRIPMYVMPLPPGESVEYIWGQIDNDGAQVVPGTYTICNQQNNVDINIIGNPEIDVDTDKSTYEFGEIVHISINNVGDIDAMVYGYWIEDSYGKIVFAPRIPMYVMPLPPGESVEYTWDQIDNDGTQVASGTYTICNQLGNTIIDITTPSQDTNDDKTAHKNHSNSNQKNPVIPDQHIIPKPTKLQTDF